MAKQRNRATSNLAILALYPIQSGPVQLVLGIKNLGNDKASCRSWDIAELRGSSNSTAAGCRGHDSPWRRSQFAETTVGRYTRCRSGQVLPMKIRLAVPTLTYRTMFASHECFFTQRILYTIFSLHDGSRESQLMIEVE